MIETSLLSWLVFAGLVLAASAAGITLARLWNWSAASGGRGVALSWGLGLGPFLLGMASVLVLWLLPGAKHGVHLAAVAALLLVPAAAALRLGHALPAASPPQARGLAQRLLAGLLLAWVGGLLANTLFIPLAQNDSLEYATVGRILFEARALSAYPVLHPEQTASGFYGPWTHPPLYVALVYIASVAQGHADAPGLMRLVAPWALVAATCLVYALGATVRRSAGPIAALVFIGAPLLFLGAESALLDSLPVLGLVLVIAALAFVQGPAWQRALAGGCALGLSLWSHSQAVLFLPLACAALLLVHGWRHWRAWLPQAAAMVGVAALLGVWPYVRNMLLLGTPISDNPVVFALPELAWADYFRTGRGIGTWPAVVQYGWLKGWFAVEAYGFAFWFMLPGLVLLAASWRRRAAAPLLLASAAAVACYLMGLVASTLLGMDLMIKNERYMLVILPLVSVLAGAGLARWFDARPVLVLLFCGLCAAQLAVLVGYRFKGNDISLLPPRPFEQTLQGRPEYRAVDYLRNHAPPDALVFSLKPADMYYAGRRMVSYLDPRLVPFYGEQDASRAHAMLRTMGVTHVHIPDYGLPPLNNGPLSAVLRNPAWATLVFQSDGNAIYALAPAGLAEGAATDLLSGGAPWWRSTSLIVGGRKSLANLDGPPTRIGLAQPSRGGIPLGLFQREASTLLSTGLRGDPPALPPPGSLAVQGGKEYALDLDVEGKGLVRIWLQAFGAEGPLRDSAFRSQSRFLLTDLTLGGTHPQRMFSRRVRMHPDARYVVVTLEHVGTSELRVRSARLVPLLADRP